MYKMCDRCRFSVPAKQVLCHVCGSREFVSNETPALKPIEASLKNCKDTFGGAIGKMQSAFTAFGREIEETAHKAQRATDSMRKLIFEAGPDHDQVLSFHRSIGAGRNVQFAPISLTASNDSRETMPASRASVSSFSHELTMSDSIAPLSNLVSDDALFSPAISFVEYMAAHSVSVDAASSTDAFANNFAEALPDFLSLVVDAPKRVALVGPVRPTENDEEAIADVDSLRKNIDELKGWFESYGKEGLLVKAELAIAKPADQVAETSTDVSELEHSQAA
jgi:hypothetical protein